MIINKHFKRLVERITNKLLLLQYDLKIFLGLLFLMNFIIQNPKHYVTIIVESKILNDLSLFFVLEILNKFVD
jgi:hypothetical protein